MISSTNYRSVDHYISITYYGVTDLHITDVRDAKASKKSRLLSRQGIPLHLNPKIHTTPNKSCLVISGCWQCTTKQVRDLCLNLVNEQEQALARARATLMRAFPCPSSSVTIIKPVASYKNYKQHQR